MTARIIHDIEGTIIPCQYCESSMTLKDGAWGWNHEPLPPLKKYSDECIAVQDEAWERGLF